MNASLLVRVLLERWRLRQHDRWSRERLLAHQAQGLEALRRHAYARSPFYQWFHRGLEARPLPELPVLTKALLMERFDELVTDPAVRLEEVEAHLKTLRGDERFLGRYRVCATSGSTGRRGIFLFGEEEWATVLASYARVYAWGGVRVGLGKRSKIAVVSTTTPFHQSARVGSSVQSPFVPALRLDATDPLPQNVERLNRFQPEALVAYASMGRALAVEQLEGRLRIAPKTVFCASEVLTDEARRLIARAWGRQPFDVYGATEAATIAAECEHHDGLHLFEDLVITEVVDERYRPVPPGEYGDKVLVTVLFSRTQPLIRYEMSDRVRLSERPCPSGWPYRLVDGIQGRLEDVLRLPGREGGTVAVHPNVFHDVIDLAPAAGWQVVYAPGRLQVLLAGRPDPALEQALPGALAQALLAQGAAPVPVEVRWVEALPKNALGKTPLIRQEG